jgi:type VI secretion system secreted protein Hcp
LGSGVGSPQDFHFVIKNGKASPLLLKHVANGKHLANAILKCRKTTGDANPEVYLEVKFTDLVVSSYQLGGSGGGGESPMEQISFNFSKMDFDQKKQGQDGTLVAGDQVSWNVKEQSVA